MQDAPKAVWSIPYVSVAFFPSLKHNFNAYHSSKVSSRPDCIFEIHQLWQLGFSRVYSNSCSNCSFEPEIIKIGQSSHKMYNNNIVNFQEFMTILNACTNSLETYWMHHVHCKLKWQKFSSALDYFVGLPPLSAKEFLLIITRQYFQSSKMEENTKVSISLLEKSPANLVLYWTWHYKIVHSIQYPKVTCLNTGNIQSHTTNNQWTFPKI